MNKLKIYVSRHSAFYSPLLATISAGFLRDEGLEASYAVLAPGATSREMIERGHADIIQSAVSSSFRPLRSGVSDLPIHFAQINCRDGFFLVSREDDPFNWQKLAGHAVVADHAAQPLAMLHYASRINGVAIEDLVLIDAGTPAEMAAAFRSGRGEYVHLQSPEAHQLETEDTGRVKVSVGASIPEVAFSSLCASPQFLETEAAARFLNAFRRAKAWVRSAPAADIAASLAPFFPSVAAETVLTAVAAYQQIGCWNGDTRIFQSQFEQALRVFGEDLPYEKIVRNLE